MSSVVLILCLVLTTNKVSGGLFDDIFDITKAVVSVPNNVIAGIRAENPLLQNEMMSSPQHPKWLPLPIPPPPRWDQQQIFPTNGESNRYPVHLVLLPLPVLPPPGYITAINPPSTYPPNVGTNPQPTYPPNVGTNPQPTYPPNVGTNPQPTYPPNVGTNPQPTYPPNVVTNPQPTYPPNVGTNPQPTYPPNVGTNPQPTYPPNLETNPPNRNQPFPPILSSPTPMKLESMLNIYANELEAIERITDCIRIIWDLRPKDTMEGFELETELYDLNELVHRMFDLMKHGGSLEDIRKINADISAKVPAQSKLLSDFILLFESPGSQPLEHAKENLLMFSAVLRGALELYEKGNLTPVPKDMLLVTDFIKNEYLKDMPHPIYGTF